jgi:hypothetical protein
MNKIDHPNIVKKEVFAIADNGRLYRIARHVEETPEDKVENLFNSFPIQQFCLSKKKFTLKNIELI